MNKVESIKLIRTITVIGGTIACCIFATNSNPVIRALSISPFTLLSAICAYMYHSLDRKEKDKVYKLSVLHLRTIVMYPYFLLACMIFINILCVVTVL